MCCMNTWGVNQLKSIDHNMEERGRLRLHSTYDVNQLMLTDHTM